MWIGFVPWLGGIQTREREILGKGGASMAAQLTDEGRFPAVQKLTKAEFSNFVNTCNAPAQPSPGLIGLLSQYKKAK